MGCSECNLYVLAEIAFFCQRQALSVIFPAFERL